MNWIKAKTNANAVVRLGMGTNAWNTGNLSFEWLFAMHAFMIFLCENKCGLLWILMTKWCTNYISIEKHKHIHTHTCENINILIHTFAHSIQTDPHLHIRFLHIMICKWISVSWTKSCYHWKEINKNIKRAHTHTFHGANVKIIWVLKECGRRPHSWNIQWYASELSEIR